jgi:tryptophan 2,3-dioxygenase
VEKRWDSEPKGAHDEMLFIITHQTYELWFKQILHEVDSIRRIFAQVPVDERKIAIAVSRLQRVKEILGVLLQQVSILETMSPLDFLEFRDLLYPASGFQSVQFRLLENKLGLSQSQRMAYGHRGYCTYLREGADNEAVRKAEREPSLFSLVEQWLERTPFLQSFVGAEQQAPGQGPREGDFTWWRHYQQAVEAMLGEDERAIREMPVNSGNPDRSTASALLAWGPTSEQRDMQLQEVQLQRDSFGCLFDEQKYRALQARGDRRLSWRATQASLLITLYADEPILLMPSKLISCLVDLDEQLIAWRQRHALMVHRMLGVKMGTGGSSGYAYLRATAERHKIFSDFATLSTFLVPRVALPPLPQSFRASLSFQFEARQANGIFPTAVAPAPAPATTAVAASGEPARCPVSGAGEGAHAASNGTGGCPFGHGAK